MAGFREFVTGEVLTAANVDDFLMKQSVQKYADAAARDAALGTAVADGNALREGMVAYLDSTDEVIKYDGTDWSSVAPAIAGIGSNVVQTVKTDVFSASVATGTESAAAMTATITPTTATSKVLVIVQASVASAASDGSIAVSLYRDNAASAYRGDADGSRRRIANGQAQQSSNRFAVSATIVYLDSPETTSATTYDIRLSSDSASTQALYLNRGQDDSNLTAVARSASSITLIEVSP